MCKQNKETIDNLLLHCPIAEYIEVFVGNQLFRGVIFWRAEYHEFNNVVFE